ncbi:MAG: hypothetical protein C7K11_01350 [Candidatus Amulumruptor caecigallinarius]|mgnify:CR=1 FL=1|uniref:Uncharacterized protein n=1 Tax=Candidatus Amulumruptor caecigallinarius TaxID=2109911 RepID=A0A4Q0UAN7_9BACT|nr:MAG: hypothetical protein C7K11_01350 [Candidatus Amulumruptor caecigallinarius]HJE39779.1 hypothetical protein [Candidatus Amulumruptor caecigallinarius]
MKHPGTATDKTLSSSVLENIGRRDGMTVPDGYFDTLTQRIEASLPEREWERQSAADNIAPRSIWQRIRPYVYLAAMFAGIWCMMHIFSLTGTGTQGPMSIDNYPVLAQALSDPTVVEELSNETFYTTNEEDLMDLLWQEGFDPTDETAATAR